MPAREAASFKDQPCLVLQPSDSPQLPFTEQTFLAALLSSRRGLCLSSLLLIANRHPSAVNAILYKDIPNQNCLLGTGMKANEGQHIRCQ